MSAHWKKHIQSNIYKMSLWLAVGLVSFIFLAIGIIELLMPVAEMARILPWADSHPVWFTRSLGIVDIAGGLGILLPFVLNSFVLHRFFLHSFVLHKLPRLLAVAALGCASKQIVAICYHLTIGEPSVVPLNLALLTLSLFIFLNRRENRKSGIKNQLASV
ncbi:DoxX family protein [Marinobacterium mangrovicola]|uniref:DoxX-like protein n=1 Tax=Marinobacterium mangrovicola TaxID=1476959 RepID=A0A4V2PEM2_9GAMM|nr:DoxX family protein [Marinobacterium mangrovicola]TCK09326.1 DoxX-like protein [Marinobacterium mangrovicola]